MAIAEEDNKQEQELAKLQASLKTNRRLLHGMLAVAAIIVSVLITSLIVVSVQLSGRRDVPTEEFAAELETLRMHLKHLVELHNAEAKVYFDFQDRLDELEQLYSHEDVNQLRRSLTERERDHRKLLALMAESTNSLALMMPGSREWTRAFGEEISAAAKLSDEREKAIKEAMLPQPKEADVVAPAGASPAPR